MKARLMPGIIILCLFSTIFLLHNFMGRKNHRILKKPQPIDLNKNLGEKKEFKQKRKDWIENMHRTAPGVDWRAMDRKTRDQKNAAKLSKRTKMLAKGQLRQQRTVEQFANGLVAGKWIEKGSNNLSGRMHTTEVDFQNNLIYAGSAGGNIWISDLAGNKWHSINDFLQFDDINMVRRIPYNDGNRLIVVSANRVAYTDNDGLTWDFAYGLRAFRTGGYIIQGVMANDENNTIFLLASERSLKDGRVVTTIYKSTDSGKVFLKIHTLDAIAYDCHIWTSRYENTKVFIVKEDEVYTVSNTSPLEFVSKINVQFPIETLENMAITGNKDASNIYITYFVGGEGLCYRSTNRGSTWTRQESVEQGIFTKRSFYCSQLKPDHIYLGGIDAFRSTSGGNEWEMINAWGEYYSDSEHKLHADISEIISFLNDEGEEIFYLSTDGGLYVSNDNCQTVKNISLEGLRISQYYSISERRHRLYLCRQPGSGISTLDMGDWRSYRIRATHRW